MINSSQPTGEQNASLGRMWARRPALWFSLLVVFLGLVGLAGAQWHENRLDAHYERIRERQASLPYQAAKIRSDLASKELTTEGLEKELERRLGIASVRASDEFYITIDTAKRKLRLQLGSSVVREADITIGEPRAIKVAGKSWEFPPFKGAVTVRGKVINHPWPVPPWVYAMNGTAVPADLPTVEGGLGKYVITLPNGYVVHSPPSPESPLQGPKPASFMATEEDLEAIWPQVTTSTRVYVDEAAL
jgi:hypothetical protein